MDPISRSRPFFHPMPKGVKSPASNYYADIKWGHGFEQWPLVRFSTQADGSCLFHAIVNSFWPEYWEEKINDKSVSRSLIIETLRRELSEKLAARVSDAADSPTYYETLNRGYTATMAREVKEYSLEHMQRELNSHAYIGYGYIEFIGRVLRKDIYILEAVRRDVYQQVEDELELTLTGDRDSIVLYYTDNGHYELVGVANPDGTFSTYFGPDHSLIRFLYARAHSLRAERIRH